MDNFEALPIEKQAVILDAGYQCFGKLGYKKASTADIAAMAGISKAMIFHYFGTKKEMYLYLARTASKRVIRTLEGEADHAPADFFDRMLLFTSRKIELLKECPSMLAFLTSAYQETAPEVKDELKNWVQEGTTTRTEFLFTELDSKKFKENVSPELVFELVMGYAIGSVNQQFWNTDNLDEMLERVTRCMNMMKENFYKEEFL